MTDPWLVRWLDAHFSRTVAVVITVAAVVATLLNDLAGFFLFGVCTYLYGYYQGRDRTADSVIDALTEGDAG